MRKLWHALISLYIWSIGMLVFFLWSLLFLTVALFFRGPLLERQIKWACRLILAIAGIRVEVENLEYFQADRQYIVMLNHVNIFDGLVLYGHFPGSLCGLEEESHFKWPVYGWVSRKIGNIPVSRQSGLRARKSLKRAAELIRKEQDFSVAILPEGTRTKDGRLGRFKRGGFLLAAETGLDILPVIQIGSYAIKKKNSWLIRPGKIRLVFEQAIPTGKYSDKDQQLLLEVVRNVYYRYIT